MNMRRSNYDMPPKRDYMNSALLEEENDELVDNLSHKVRALKNVSIEIGAEVRAQNKYIAGDLDAEFDSGAGLLGNTMKRVRLMAGGGHNRIMCYMVGFALLVFTIVYLLSKARG